MIFKTKKYYKKRLENLDFQNYCLQITLQDTIEENEKLKSKIEQLKSEKTMHHKRIQLYVETEQYKPLPNELYERLKCKVLNEIDKNFEKYVKVSPIIENPCEMKCKQFATIFLEERR